jgi:DNA-binding NarL/FixJ family response regulator
MVGRDRDLADLREAHLTTLSGAPRVVVVAGEAGIGKTRLLGEFLEGLDPEVVVARGQCVAMGSLGTPFAPVRGVIRDLVSRFGAETVLTAAGPAGRLLSALLPELATEGAPAEEVAQEQLHDIVGQLLLALSDRAPLVVLVEDAHWADVATVDLLRALVAGLRRGRVTAVLSYRSEDVGRSHPMRPFLLELDRDRQVLRLELTRLSTAEAAELAQLIRGELPDPRDLALLVERSEGVPFFVEELLGLESLEGGALPETLRELVLARYVRLDERTQAALRLIAAGGVSVDHDLLGRVHGGDPSDLDQSLRTAIAAQLLVTEGTSYTFRHALTQEAVHEELLPGERARFHARYAAALEELPHLAGSRAEVAHHWLAAHDLPRALAATVVAAREAVASGAPAVGGRLGERALELWPQVPDAVTLTGMEKADLFLATASAYDEAGDARAMAVLDEALAECPREDRRRYALLLHETFVVWHAHSRPGGKELAVQALELLPPGGSDEDEVVRLRVQVGLGISLVISRHDPHAGLAVLEEAVALGRDLLDRSLAPDLAARVRFEVARALTNVGFTRSEQGDVEAAFQAWDEALRTSPEDPRTRLRDTERRSLLLCGLGRFEEAAQVAAEGHALAREVGQERGWGLSIAQSGVIATLALGRLAEAERILDRIRAAKPWGFVRAYEGALRAELHVLRDESAAAEETLADAGPLIDETAANDIEDAMAMVVARVSVALARGDLPGGWAQLRPVLDGEVPPPGTSYRALVLAARVLGGMRRAGVTPEGTTLAEVEQVVRQRFGRVTTWEVKSRWQALLEAELSGPEGDGSDAAAWQAAVGAAAAGCIPVHEHAHALYRLAVAQIAGGDRAAAAESLTEAAELAGRTGLVRVGRLVDDLASRSGIDRPRRQGSGLELTARERQVLELVTQGLTNRQIGERLFISDKTASVHVSAILRKLGTSSRTEAAVRAAQLGLDLTAPGPAS